ATSRNSSCFWINEIEIVSGIS
ncbi:hypothetical protein CP8484711_2222, partial [Chlamydia psittaci 84-8471/1]